MSITLSLAEARRLAIASQGFGPRPRRRRSAHVRKLAARVHAFQIDSVNVLARAHYVPAFARLGPYPMNALDALAYRKREALRVLGTRGVPAAARRCIRSCATACTATKRRSTCDPTAVRYMANVYAEVAERGPIAAPA